MPRLYREQRTRCPVPAPMSRPSPLRKGAGSTTLWVNFLSKQSVPTHRPISFRARTGPCMQRTCQVPVRVPRPSPGVPSQSRVPSCREPSYSRRETTPWPRLSCPRRTAIPARSEKRGPISIVQPKTRSAEIEFLCACKQLGKFSVAVGERICRPSRVSGGRSRCFAGGGRGPWDARRLRR
jgi:hypothetical protein